MDPALADEHVLTARHLKPITTVVVSFFSCYYLYLLLLLASVFQSLLPRQWAADLSAPGWKLVSKAVGPVITQQGATVSTAFRKPVGCCDEMTLAVLEETPCSGSWCLFPVPVPVADRPCRRVLSST